MCRMHGNLIFPIRNLSQRYLYCFVREYDVLKMTSGQLTVKKTRSLKVFNLLERNLN